jgi:hypothetical protein
LRFNESLGFGKNSLYFIANVADFLLQGIELNLQHQSLLFIDFLLFVLAHDCCLAFYHP